MCFNDYRSYNAVEDMANVNTTKLRESYKVCMNQGVGKHFTLVIRIDFAVACEYKSTEVYVAAAA